MSTTKKGRPSKFSQEIADRICYMVETEAKGLKKLCDENADLPGFRTVFTWLTEHEDFRQQYARAREGQADTIADRMLDLAFAPSKNLVDAQDKRTQMDALKWIASKLKPKKYGDKLDANVNHSGSIEVKAEFGRDQGAPIPPENVKTR